MDTPEVDLVEDDPGRALTVSEPLHEGRLARTDNYRRRRWLSLTPWKGSGRSNIHSSVTRWAVSVMKTTRHSLPLP